MGVIDRRSQIAVSVITDMGALMEAMTIRSAVFVDEYGCLHDEEFDGNDFSATHIIAKIGNEPAGTMRLRYFADFVIPERLAVLPPYRKGRYGDRGIAYALATFSFRLARMKGYRRFIGYSVVGLEQFWDRVALASGGKVDRFSDHPIECSGSTCVGVFGSLEPMTGAIHAREDPHILTACEAELPRYVSAKTEMLQSMSGDALLATFTHPGRRHTDQQATERRASNRRDDERRAFERGRTDRRHTDRWVADSGFTTRTICQDQRFGEQHLNKRRIDDQRMSDRRISDQDFDRRAEDPADLQPAAASVA